MEDLGKRPGPGYFQNYLKADRVKKIFFLSWPTPSHSLDLYVNVDKNESFQISVFVVYIMLRWCMNISTETEQSYHLNLHQKCPQVDFCPHHHYTAQYAFKSKQYTNIQK